MICFMMYFGCAVLRLVQMATQQLWLQDRLTGLQVLVVLVVLVPVPTCRGELLEQAAVFVLVLAFLEVLLAQEMLFPLEGWPQAVLMVAATCQLERLMEQLQAVHSKVQRGQVLA